MSKTNTAFRVSTAQVDAPTDPREAVAIRRAGRDIRQLMSDAREQDARLIHFGEGSLCSPNRRILSSDPTIMAAAD